MKGSVGRFVYAFFNQLIARDLHHLEEIEDRAQALEDQVLNNQLKEFTAPMTALRKETMAWFRYYAQLDDVACELRKNDNRFFSQEETLLFQMFEDRVIRLREESQLLREYCAQIQNMFQAEDRHPPEPTSCRSSPSSPPSSSPSPCWWAGTG